MAQAPNYHGANDVVIYQEGAFLSPLKAAMVLALELAAFFRAEIIRTREAIQALPANSAFARTIYRRHLRYCLRSFRICRLHAIRANRAWLNSFIQF